MNKKVAGILILTGLGIGVVGCGGDSNSPSAFSMTSDDWFVDEGWKLEWSDEFDDSSIDSSIWTHQIGYGSNGWGNEEWQYYTDDEDNSSVTDGVLSITARSDGSLGYQDGSITSARLFTKNNIDFQYGKIAAKIKIPTGQGIWPAFWMLGANIDSVDWPQCGEIDIAEKIGGSDTNERTAFGYMHYADSSGNRSASGGRVKLDTYLSDDYHVYEVEWSESSIIWKIDGYQYHSESISASVYDEFREPFFLTLNIAVGGRLPGDPDKTTVFPQRMLVDWVRVYKND